MARRLHHRLPSWWPLTLASALAFTTGCSVEPEPEGEFVAYRTDRGTLAYRFENRGGR